MALIQLAIQSSQGCTKTSRVRPPHLAFGSRTSSTLNSSRYMYIVYERDKRSVCWVIWANNTWPKVRRWKVLIRGGSAQRWRRTRNRLVSVVIMSPHDLWGSRSSIANKSTETTFVRNQTVQRWQLLHQGWHIMQTLDHPQYVTFWTHWTCNSAKLLKVNSDLIQNIRQRRWSLSQYFCPS